MIKETLIKEFVRVSPLILLFLASWLAAVAIQTYSSWKASQKSWRLICSIGCFVFGTYLFIISYVLYLKSFLNSRFW